MTAGCNITIVGAQACEGLARAIDAGLDQRNVAVSVTVVDDASTDDTPKIAARYANESRFAYVRLGRRLGVAQCKNLGLVLSPCDAISFHDPRDEVSKHKLSLQLRALEDPRAVRDAGPATSGMGRSPDEPFAVEVALCAHELVRQDGTTERIDSRISLVDDFFPNLQFPARSGPERCAFDVALFRRSVFVRLGGFLDSTEADRDLRNRTLAAGCIVHFVPTPLLRRFAASSSGRRDTGLAALHRLEDHRDVLRRVALYRQGCWGNDVAQSTRVTIDLSDVPIEEVIHAETLAVAQDVPVTDETRVGLGAALRSHSHQSLTGTA